MSENLLATLVTVAIFLSVLIWAPLLNVVCPACSRLLDRHRHPPNPQHPPESTPDDGL